jgi:hypothetical protein
MQEELATEIATAKSETEALRSRLEKAKTFFNSKREEEEGRRVRLETLQTTLVSAASISSFLPRPSGLTCVHYCGVVWCDMIWQEEVNKENASLKVSVDRLNSELAL